MAHGEPDHSRRQRDENDTHDQRGLNGAHSGEDLLEGKRLEVLHADTRDCYSYSLIGLAIEDKTLSSRLAVENAPGEGHRQIGLGEAKRLLCEKVLGVGVGGVEVDDRVAASLGSYGADEVADGSAI